MATKLGPSYLFSFSAVCVLLICCWASLVESNPVWAETNNQLDRVRSLPPPIQFPIYVALEIISKIQFIIF